MTATSLTLDFLTGPRTYIPPPHHVIIRAFSAEKTKTGLLTPGQKPAMGTVLAIGAETKGAFQATAPPCEVGDIVIFDPTSPAPVREFHKDLLVFDWGIIILAIREGEHEDGVYYVPEGEAGSNGGMEVVG